MNLGTSSLDRSVAIAASLRANLADATSIVSSTISRNLAMTTYALAVELAPVSAVAVLVSSWITNSTRLLERQGEQGLLPTEGVHAELRHCGESVVAQSSAGGSE